MTIRAAYEAGREAAFKKFAGLAGTLLHHGLQNPRIMQSLVGAGLGGIGGAVAGGEGHRLEGAGRGALAGGALSAIAGHPAVQAQTMRLAPAIAAHPGIGIPAAIAAGIGIPAAAGAWAGSTAQNAPPVADQLHSAGRGALG